MKTADPKKYKKLVMSNHARDLLENDPIKFASYCNGVGSTVTFWGKLTYHLTPNTIGFVNITGPSDIHDVECTIPKNFSTEQEAREWFYETNDRFESNLKTVLDPYSTDWLAWYRCKMVDFYVDMVNSDQGWRSFMNGKVIG